MLMAKYTWTVFILKMTDLIEPTLLILSKKHQGIVQFLITHHLYAFIAMWPFVKFVPGFSDKIWYLIFNNFEDDFSQEDIR